MCQSVFKHQVTTLKIRYGQPCAKVSLKTSSYYIEDTIWPVMCQCVFKHQVTTLKMQYGQPCAKVSKHQVTTLKTQYGQPCAKVSLKTSMPVF